MTARTDCRVYFDPDPPSSDFGSTANLPKPDSFNTGPSGTLTPISNTEALAILRADKYLSGVEINGSITLGGSNSGGTVNNSTQENWVLENSRILAGGTYGFMSQYWNPLSPEYRPKFRYVEIVGRGVDPAQTSASSVINAKHAIFEYCEMYGCADGAKLWEGVELSACFIHDLWHNGQDAPSNSHCDAIQIQASPTANKVRWCNLDAVVAYQPSGAPNYRIGSRGSGVLQTGSLNSSINANLFHDNWWDGATILCRMGDTGYPTPNAEGEVIDYQFRRNKFGRNYSTAVTDGGRSGTNYQSSLGGVRFDNSNVFEDTGLPV
jgi:hypothetical protein